MPNIATQVKTPETMQHYETRRASAAHSPQVRALWQDKLVKDPNFMAYMNARKFAAFTTSYYNLTVYGICNDCARRLKRKRENEEK